MLSKEEIRKLYMEDSEWERTSDSWKALIPNRNFNSLDITDETELEYQQRLAPRFYIPIEVIKQWLYPLYYNRNSINNYGWINYDNVHYIESTMNYKTLSELYVIKKYQDYVNKISQCMAYNQFTCTKQDKEYWIKFSTWKVPPIILDVQSIPVTAIPNYADIQGCWQLIEGHSRLGYLYSLQNCKLLTQNIHKVYILKYKNN